MTDRCCCGRIVEWVEPVIINGIRHERLGDDEAFCGPELNHAVRDLSNEVDRLRAENERLAEENKVLAVLVEDNTAAKAQMFERAAVAEAQCAELKAKNKLLSASWTSEHKAWHIEHEAREKAEAQCAAMVEVVEEAEGYLQKRHGRKRLDDALAAYHATTGEP